MTSDISCLEDANLLTISEMIDKLHRVAKYSENHYIDNNVIYEIINSLKILDLKMTVGEKCV
jgi:hypothetical protein